MQNFSSVKSNTACLKLKVLFFPAWSAQSVILHSTVQTSQTLLRQKNKHADQNNRFFMLLVNIGGD